MDKLLCRQIYCHVIKEGSFSGAARKLHISKVMVSRAVSQLEEDLAVRLLYRTTRQMRPTNEGLAYFERCQPLLEDLDNLDTSVREKHETAKGLLRVAIPSEAFSVNYLMPHIFSFMETYPEVEFNILTGDRYVDLVDEGFDVAIRIGKLEDSSYIARKIDNMSLLVCATPHYLATNSTIEKPEDIQKHSLLVDTIYRSGRSWLFKKEGASVPITIGNHFKVNSPLITVEAILRGLGVGASPSFIAQPYIDNGQLKPILTDWELLNGGVYIIYSHRRHLSAKVSLFAEHLLQHFQPISR